jgi:hypothetical protein
MGGDWIGSSGCPRKTIPDCRPDRLGRSGSAAMSQRSKTHSFNLSVSNRVSAAAVSFYRTAEVRLTGVRTAPSGGAPAAIVALLALVVGAMLAVVLR